MLEPFEPKELKHKGRPREFDREQALRSALEIFWKKGYAPTSVADLCKGMGINAPSLYSCYGNKAALFIEAVRYYEKTYWHEINRNFLAEPDIYKAVQDYFEESARIILSPETPCGCMLVVSAVNISEEETGIRAAIDQMRQNAKEIFAKRLSAAIKTGQIPADTDVPALSGALYALFEGLALQARDGLYQSQLKAMASFASQLLPAAHS